ncbi:hypothetical protein LH89_22305 [Dickeya fangzhongdai]|nr:hypothetical protein LH89_22305 [Dickeya fangzhongdai]
MVWVINLCVQTTSGVSSVMRSLALTVTFFVVTVTDSDATTVALLMPVTVSAPLAGSYSITAPSGKRMWQASAEADGAGWCSL